MQGEWKCLAEKQLHSTRAYFIGKSNLVILETCKLVHKKALMTSC